MVAKLLSTALACAIPCALVSALPGCGYSGKIAQLTDASLLPQNYLPGETMHFEIHMGPVPVGTAILTVGDDAPQADARQAALVVHSRISSGGLSELIMEINDETTSFITPDTAMPRVTKTTAQYGAVRFSSDATFDGSHNVSIEFTRPPKPQVHIRLATPKGNMPHDMHTAMAALRPWVGVDGETRTLWVVGGRRLWKADVTWMGAETISTALGQRAAVRFDGVAQRFRQVGAPERKRAERRFRVWLSDDADRVPLRVEAFTEIADVVVDLVDYRRP